MLLTNNRTKHFKPLIKDARALLQLLCGTCFFTNLNRSSSHTTCQKKEHRIPILRFRKFAPRRRRVLEFESRPFYCKQCLMIAIEEDKIKPTDPGRTIKPIDKNSPLCSFDSRNVFLPHILGIPLPHVPEGPTRRGCCAPCSL